MKKPRCLSFGLVHDRHHPADTESILEDAELWRPKGFLELHRHEPPITERGKNTFGFRFIRDRDRKRESFEVPWTFALAIRCHDRCLTNSQARVHHFFIEAFWEPGLPFRRILEPRHLLDFGAQRLAIKFDRLFAAAAKKEVRLNRRVR